MKNLILITGLTLSLILTVLSCNNQPQTSKEKVENSVNNSSNDILLVKYHADWCGSCKTLAPILTELNAKLSGKNVKYVELDFTDEMTTSAAKAEATKLGIASFLTEGKQKTGYVAIIDANSKKEMGRLTKTQSVSEMYKEVLNNL